MMKRIALLLGIFAFAACSRPVTGVYQTTGSESQFRMGLELNEGGQAKFVTRSNLGNPALDRAVESKMGVPTGRWTKEGSEIALTGARADGKAVTHRFVIQENGDLIWKENGARFVRSRER